MRKDNRVAVAQRTLFHITIPSTAQKPVVCWWKLVIILTLQWQMFFLSGWFRNNVKSVLRKTYIRNSLSIFLSCKIEVYMRLWVSISNPPQFPPHPHGTWIFSVKSTVSLFSNWGCCSISFLMEEFGNLQFSAHFPMSTLLFKLLSPLCCCLYFVSFSINKHTKQEFHEINPLQLSFCMAVWLYD